MEPLADVINLRFFIGGYWATNTELRSQQNELVYYRSLMPFRNEWFLKYAEPITVDFKALHQALVPCLEWASQYDSDILDGTQWVLSLQINGQSRECYGSNAYPNNFNQVVDELERIIQKPLR